MIFSDAKAYSICLASILRLYYFVLHLNPTIDEEEDLTCTPLLANTSLSLQF